MRVQHASPQQLLIFNNNWSRDWISPAFFLFLSLLWHFLFFPLIFDADDAFVYYFTHSIIRRICFNATLQRRFLAKINSNHSRYSFFALSLALIYTIVVLTLLNWPISEQVVLDKEKNTVNLRRKLLIKTTEYNTTLDGAKDVTFETYKSRGRLSLSYADGMRFPLSTSYFPSKALEDTVANEIRAFLGFKTKKSRVSVTDNLKKQDSSVEQDDQDSDSSVSDSDSEDSDVVDEDGKLNWDKAIDDWESDVKERKAFRS